MNTTFIIRDETGPDAFVRCFETWACLHITSAGACSRRDAVPCAAANGDVLAHRI